MFLIQKKLLLTGGSASALTLLASAFPLQSAYASTSSISESTYDISFEQAVDRQMKSSAPPQTDRNGRWQNASRSDVSYYMNPNNFSQGTSSYLQFLDLQSSAGLSASSINSQLLAGKGTLSGQGQSFINASKLYNVNEIYLISHALLETGNGGSRLATGVEVNGRTVYNMYGIGAFDGDAVRMGAQYAYNQGWFTPEDAIIGGARFVSNSYMARGQNTLYKMRWNPANPATYQYATDIGWAVKQTHHMSNLYNLVDDYHLRFDVPVYNNQPAGTIPDSGELEQLPPDTYGTTTARLNVRTGPGQTHSVITTLSINTKVELLAKQGSWYQIRVGSSTGFISGSYLKLDPASEDQVEEGTENPIAEGTTTARLNLRSQPNTSSSIRTTLTSGQTLQILAKEGNWYQVRVGFQTGWVSADYVKITEEEIEESPTFETGETTARLNLRSGAGTSHRILTTLPLGQKLEIIKKEGNWLQVKAGSQTGWVSSDHVKTSGDNAGQTPSLGSGETTARLNLRSGAGTSHRILTTLPLGQKLEIIKKEGNWLQVKAGSQTGWVSSDHVKTSGDNAGQTPSLGSGETTARLNLRSGAGTSHRILTTLPLGQKLEIIKKEGNWLQVKAGSQTGWVSSDHVKTSGQESKLESGTTTARVNLRTGAATNNRILTTLNIGQKINILQKQNGWYQVTVGGQTGWVSAEYVQLGNVQPKVQVLARTFNMAPFHEPNEETSKQVESDVITEDDSNDASTEVDEEAAYEPALVEDDAPEQVELDSDADVITEDDSNETSTDFDEEVAPEPVPVENDAPEQVELDSDSDADVITEDDSADVSTDLDEEVASEPVPVENDAPEQVELDSDDDSTEVDEEEAAYEPAPVEDDAPEQVELDSDDNLSLYTGKVSIKDNTMLLSKPSKDNQTDIELDAGSVVEVIEQNGDFMLVEFEGNQGWISVNLLVS